MEHIKQTGNPPKGYKGGKAYFNDGREGSQLLPKLDAEGKPITYKEYDVNPKQIGQDRGAERLVIGSDGNAYYTDDHFTSFTLITN